MTPYATVASSAVHREAFATGSTLHCTLMAFEGMLYVDCFAVVVVLAVFADPKSHVIPSFQNNPLIPFGFFILVLALTI